MLTMPPASQTACDDAAWTDYSVTSGRAAPHRTGEQDLFVPGGRNRGEQRSCDTRRLDGLVVPGDEKAERLADCKPELLASPSGLPERLSVADEEGGARDDQS